jgi:hypothetical protein
MGGKGFAFDFVIHFCVQVCDATYLNDSSQNPFGRQGTITITARLRAKTIGPLMIGTRIFTLPGSKAPSGGNEAFFISLSV